MKIKKHISKLLFYSILLSSVPFNSNAVSNSDLSRYETLEGEFIDLDDTKSEDITEIEIFGNTVQDPNNLEDIQSIGDLYVNEEGEPILDKYDRKQYKIEIKSISSNLFNPNMQILDNSYITDDGNIKSITGYGVGLEYIRIYPSTTYICENTNYVAYYDINKKFIKREPSYGFQEFTTPSNCYYVRFQIEWSRLEGKNLSLHRFAEGTKANRYNIPKYQSNSVSILLPCQLMKVGNISDRLYWDSEKSRYIVEKNIASTKLNKSSGFSSMGVYNNTKIFYKVIEGMIGTNDLIHMTSLCKQTTVNNAGKIEYIGHTYNSISADKPSIRFVESLDTDLESFLSNRIGDNEFIAYYGVSTPQLIETNIIEKIELTTYTEKTYISTVSENGVYPTLKIYIDKLEETSQEAVDNAVSTPTSNNIALARMFVNMLPDSLYKDQLQAKLNEIFSSDIVLEKQSATANLDVYIKSENILMMSLDTNTVTFEDYSGVEELELQNAINISINSSLPYQLNAYIVRDITNKDKNKTLDLDVLNIKEGSDPKYKQFTSINNKLVLLDNASKGNDISHNIDLKLNGDKAHDADVYKTTIKFEAEQK